MCGVVGVFGVEKQVDVLCDMMVAMQYRGEQSCGLFFADDVEKIYGETALGRTTELFRKVGKESLKQKKLLAGVGHLRYGTAGNRSSLENAQPMYAKMPWGEIYLAHNGDMPNFDKRKRELLEQGVVFSTDSDTELILKYIGLSKKKTPLESVLDGLMRYEGTFSLIMLMKDQEGLRLIAARDPTGNRPLALGALNGGYIIASEDSAFETIGGKALREIDPGELLIISKNGVEKHSLPPSAILKPYHCIFENIYFSSKSSLEFGICNSEGFNLRFLAISIANLCRFHSTIKFLCFTFMSSKL